MTFSKTDYQQAAVTLAVPIAAIEAVADVESSGVTHWAGGQVPILFEALWFHKLTHGQYDGSHPGISSPVWDHSLYIGGPAEYDRLDEAEALDKEAALQSASWGAFQVMGFNWADLGYASIEDFVTQVQTDAGQLDSFVRYIQHHGLENALRDQDWHAFAAGYNGSGQVDEYATRMADAYAHYASGGKPRALQQGEHGDDVMALQQALGPPLVPDGYFGPLTTAAVMAFQTSHNLQVDGIAGIRTKTALHII